MTARDNLEKAHLVVLNRKHQFIMQVVGLGYSVEEVKEFVALIDWEKEIEWATMCFEMGNIGFIVPKQG